MLLPSNRMQCFQIILQYFGSIRACNQEFIATKFFSLIVIFILQIYLQELARPFKIGKSIYELRKWVAD